MIKKTKEVQYRFFLFFLMSAATTSHAMESLEEVEGYYSSPSYLCTYLKGAKFTSCQRRFKDCLVIRKKTQGFAEFEVFSTQANQHICATKGELVQIDDNLIATSDNAKTKQNKGIAIKLSKRYLTLEYQKDQEGEEFDICGAHANLNGIKFNRNSKKKLGPICFKDE